MRARPLLAALPPHYALRAMPTGAHAGIGATGGALDGRGVGVC